MTRLAVVTVAAASTLLLAACYSWDPIPTPAPMTEFGHVRAHLCNTTTLELHDAGVVADTLKGVELRPWTGEGHQVPRAVPVDSVCAMEQRELKAGATVGLALGVAAVLGAFIAVLASGTTAAGLP